MRRVCLCSDALTPELRSIFQGSDAKYYCIVKPHPPEGKKKSYFYSLSIDKAVNKHNESTSGLWTHSVTYSSDVQDPKSASGMNFLFIGVSKVTLSNKAKEQQREQQQQQRRDRSTG